MKGTEKQIAYAESLLAEFVEPREQFIESQRKMIEQYIERDADRYAEKIAARQKAIDKAQRQIDLARSVEDAGELIDAIKYHRASWSLD
jgi:hypothetical protein